MGEITEKRRRDYSGLDADKNTIPACGKDVNDTFLATDTKILYFWDGVAWIIIPLDVIVAGMIKTDAVETLKIKDLNVTVGKLAGGITATKLAADCVETAKIKDLNVTVGKLAGGITATKLAADCVETAKIKDLNVTKGKAEVGFGRYVPIAKVTWDWGAGDFTLDSNYHIDGLDCGAKGVPAGAVAVHFQGILLDNAANTNFVLRKNATDIINVLDLLTQVANINVALNAIIMIDANLLMDYYGTTGLDTISLAVVGYFI